MKRELLEEESVKDIDSREYGEPNIFLDPEKGKDGNDGLSPENPVQCLDEAVCKAGAGSVHVMGTVRITEKASMYENVVFIRHDPDSFHGPMFVIDIPNDSQGVVCITLKGAVADGKGRGTLFEVRRGRLFLQGGSVLKNAETGVLVQAYQAEAWTQAQTELNEALIQADTAVEIAGETVNTGLGSDGGDTNNLILNASDSCGVQLRGVVKLAQGAYITVSSGHGLNGRVTVECAQDPAKAPVIAVGAGGYALTAADAENVVYGKGEDDGYGTALNEKGQMILTPFVYLNGCMGGGTGDGTARNPYRNLADALANTKRAAVIIVSGTTVVKAGSYDKEVRIWRGSELSGSDMMFDISPSDDTVTLSAMKIDGGNKGTIAEVSSGTLELTGGVTLAGCDIAVVVASFAEISVRSAFISGSKYSIRIMNDQSVFTLAPVQKTRIFSKVYLGCRACISVKSALDAVDGEITIECSEPEDDRKVAMTDKKGLFGFTEADAAKIVYWNHEYSVAVSVTGSNTLVLKSIKS